MEVKPSITNLPKPKLMANPAHQVRLLAPVTHQGLRFRVRLEDMLDQIINLDTPTYPSHIQGNQGNIWVTTPKKVGYGGVWQTFEIWFWASWDSELAHFGVLA